MSDAFKSFRCQSGFSSPSCDETEIAADEQDPLAGDSDQSRDAANRHRGERKETGGALGVVGPVTGGSQATTTDVR